MSPTRLFTILSLALGAASAFADGQRVLGKIGQAISPTTVYSSPSKHSRLIYRVAAYQQLVVKQSDNPDWDAVYLKSGAYAYTPAAKIALLPYTVYAKGNSRSSRS